MRTDANMHRVFFFTRCSSKVYHIAQNSGSTFDYETIFYCFYYKSGFISEKLNFYLQLVKYIDKSVTLVGNLQN